MKIQLFGNSEQFKQKGSRQVSREMDYYNLDMVLAVGYRVRSNIGIHFRNWASSILSEYMRKGFALNDERLKNPKNLARIILMNYLSVFVTLEHLKTCVHEVRDILLHQ